MKYRAKKLTGGNLPDRWMVEVTYRDGLSPITFTIEDLEDIDERIELRSDWIAITLTDTHHNRRPQGNARRRPTIASHGIGR